MSWRWREGDTEQGPIQTQEGATGARISTAQTRPAPRALTDGPSCATVSSQRNISDNTRFSLSRDLLTPLSTFCLKTHIGQDF